MTFKKILEEFKEFLRQDEVYEVVETKMGYTVLYWDSSDCDYFSVSYCKEPEDLLYRLLQGYSAFLERGYTKHRRDLTSEEENEIKNKCEVKKKMCQ